MAKLSEAELQKVVALYVDSNKIGVSNYTETRANIVGALDKIGKMHMLDSAFYDKLEELNGDDLPFGKTIEEYYQDLILAVDYNQDLDGTRALKFYSPTYRPVAYSYALPKKIIAQSIPNNNIERAVNNQAEATNIIASMEKRLNDSASAFKYAVKRELIGKMCDKVMTMYNDATVYANATTDITEGNAYSQNDAVAVCVKSKTHASGDTWANLVENGYLIVLKMVRKVAKPVDTTTGEAFIKECKDAVEHAQDISEGYSLNGNTIGAEYGLKLYVKQGVMPSLQVDTFSGAFNKDELSTGVETKVIKDFGSTTSKAYAVLIDPRGLKLHTDYEATRDNANGFGDFVSLFRHLEHTAFISRNTFITIFVEP